jgi:uncharacterized protein with von Willebrand factor type A (vWA) domain
MRGEDKEEFLIRVFTHLRRRDFDLGVGELLAALRLFEEDWPSGGPAELRKDVQRLWCHSWAAEHAFNEIWDEQERRKEEAKPPTASPPTTPSERSDAQDESAARSRQPAGEPLPAPPREAAVSSLPVRAPWLQEGRAEMTIRWPLSRRVMAYAWQYLRRTRAGGAATVIDLESTIADIARKGYFVSPVYRRPLRHHARLLLLVDRRGSMVPFHSLTRDLIETAQQAPTIEQAETLYFHDVATEILYTDPLLNDPVGSEQGLTDCGSETAVLIVSDAGAARGSLNADRVLATLEMLTALRRHTPLVAWLNPMPPPRWAETSAQLISHMVSMFPLDANGLIDAVKSVRGKFSKKPGPNR